WDPDVFLDDVFKSWVRWADTETSVTFIAARLAYPSVWDVCSRRLLTRFITEVEAIRRNRPAPMEAPRPKSYLTPAEQAAIDARVEQLLTEGLPDDFDAAFDAIFSKPSGSA